MDDGRMARIFELFELTAGSGLRVATISGAERDAKEAVKAAAESLPKLAVINPEAARNFEAELSRVPDGT
jgi:hypothetical protein